MLFYENEISTVFVTLTPPNNVSAESDGPLPRSIRMPSFWMIFAFLALSSSIL